jgi:glycosyltransferase involved in cell wall biosynthesis
LGAGDGSEILVGDTPKQVADHAIALLSDPELRQKVAENGFFFSRRNYSWESANEKLSSLISGTDKSKSAL